MGLRPPFLFCKPLDLHCFISSLFTDPRVTNFQASRMPSILERYALSGGPAFDFRAPIRTMRPDGKRRAKQGEGEASIQKCNHPLEIISEYVISYNNSFCQETETELQENKDQASLSPPVQSESISNWDYLM